MDFTGITRAANRLALKANKHSPQILFGVGIVGSVATVVVACRATLKVQAVNETHKSEIETAGDRLYNKVYDEHTHKTAVVQTWKHTSVEYVKLYGPAVVLGVGSIACLTKSHQILTNRNATLSLAYAGLDRAFREYRGRVVNELGLDKDTEFAHGTVEKEIVEYDKNGNPNVVRKKTVDPDARTVYGRFFDESNRWWDKDNGYNHTFLDNQQKWVNLELKRRGYMFLNDVYEALGFERSKEGQLVGWIYDTDRGDGYIDFGFNRYPDFVAGFERSVFLDFNVDGPILDQI